MPFLARIIGWFPPENLGSVLAGALCNLPVLLAVDWWFWRGVDAACGEA